MDNGIFQKNYAFLCDAFAYQRTQIFLWLPVFMGLGIALYFSLSFEPPLWWGGLAVLVVCMLLFFNKHRAALRPLLILALCACIGFFSSGLRTRLVYTPILSKEIGPVYVTGIIEGLESLEEGKGIRGIIGHVSIEKMPENATPRKLRLKFRAGQDLHIGQKIRVMAGLNQPAAPSLPAGFDFQRYLFFQGIGGVGFAYKPAEILDGGGMSDMFLLIEGVRRAVGERIERALPAREAGVANALMTGPRMAISKSDNTAISNAGLAHMLSISGLHISLLFGVVFFAVRLGLACIPAFALRHSTKKWAAVIGILAAIFYTLISGSTVPTQRSILMMGIVFLSIMLDRTPFSLRLIAFSLLCILLFFPESLTTASLQMSFASVTALIVFYEGLRHHRPMFLIGKGPVKRGLLYILGIAMTSVVATGATAPFILYHFQQVPLYSVLANVLAIPVLAVLVMPFAVLAFILMPFGLEWLPMIPIGWGIEIILWISHFVADIKNAIFIVPQWPVSALLWFCVVFVLWVLFPGRLKLLCLVPLLFFFISISDLKKPDIIVASESNLTAVKGQDGLYMFSSRTKERFVRENWVQAFGGIKGTPVTLWPKEGAKDDLMCGAEGCRMERHGTKIAFLKQQSLFAEECAWADIIIVPFPAPKCEGKIVLDKYTMRDNGVTALYLPPYLPHDIPPSAKQSAPENTPKNTLADTTIETAESYRGNRPWVANFQKYLRRDALKSSLRARSVLIE